MPWAPKLANRSRGTYSTQLIDAEIAELQQKIVNGIWEGLDQVGELAFAHAKKHAPVRKVFHESTRLQGGGKRKGMRTLTDVEVAAEAEMGDRARLGLGPGRGVRTMGRPGTNPGRPRAAQNYQIDPQFGRVGMPNSEAPYNPRRFKGLQNTPEEKAQRLDLARYADRQQARAYLREYHGTDITRLRNVARAGPASRFQVKLPGRPAAPRTNLREVYQTDISKARGGQVIRPEEHLDQPRRRVDSLRGHPLRNRRPHHYYEITGSLRQREHRDDLPHGAYGRYEPAIEGMTSAMTARGRYEAGINVSRGAQHAGRAVILNPDTGRLQVGGRLKHSITYIRPELGESVMTAWVDSPVYYTRYVEFGTRHAHAQPFLRPAVGLVREQMRELIKKAIRSKVRR